MTTMTRTERTKWRRESLQWVRDRAVTMGLNPVYRRATRTSEAVLELYDDSGAYMGWIGHTAVLGRNGELVGFLEAHVLDGPSRERILSIDEAINFIRDFKPIPRGPDA